MKAITFDEVKNIYEYEKVRKPFREKVIAAKKNRRFPIGDKMTIVFENRNSVLFQIQEMIRTEKIFTDEGMQHEIDTYNMLVPGDNELSATLLIDINIESEIKPTLESLEGLAKDSVYLKIGNSSTVATFDASQEDEDGISAVQYIKWKLSDTDARRFSDASVPVSIEVRHPNYTASHTLTQEQRAALAADLMGSTEAVSF